MQHAGLRVVIIGGVLMTLSALVPILQGIWRATPQPQPPDHPIAMLLALGFMGLGAILVFQGMWTWLSALDSLSARIDEHQHRAQEGHLKERRLLTMMQHAPESIVVLDAEANCLVEVNPAAETLFQYSSDQLVGEKTLWQLSPPLQPCGTPSKDLMERYLKQAINGTYPVFEWLHLNAKGEPLDCGLPWPNCPLQIRC
jgi:PAS domain S-box-containing protein